MPLTIKSILVRYIHDVNLFFKMCKIGIWMSGVIAWVMVWCIDSLSLSQCTMQRINEGNVKITSKNGLRNRTERCT